MATTQNLTCLHHWSLSCQWKKTFHPSRPWSCTWDDYQIPRQAVSKNISKFNPNSTEGQDIQAHLQDIDFYLEMRPHVTGRDRLYLRRATSRSEVRNFLDRQLSQMKSDYQLLREVLIKEYTDPQTENWLLTALEAKQSRQEAPRAYYNWLQQAYFGAHN